MDDFTLPTKTDDPLHQRIAQALGISLEEWLDHLADAEDAVAAGELVVAPVTDEERDAFQKWLLAEAKKESPQHV